MFFLAEPRPASNILDFRATTCATDWATIDHDQEVEPLTKAPRRALALPQASAVEIRRHRHARNDTDRIGYGQCDGRQRAP